MKNLKIGSVSIPITEYASQGNAVLGIRDSGKSYTATWIAERLLDAGIPFVAFDPIGIWKYLRVAGKKAGYPVVVAGGRNADLPLTPQSAPEIVRAAMRDNIPLVIDLYDMKLSKADWKSIVEQSVRLLLYENGDHGLRHIFIEEAAEFCPQRVGPDQGRVYAEIEKLARMGGNAQLGYTLINQRAEEVNKAVLELCDCLFLHRQKGRNSLTALGKWLDVGSISDIKPIMESMPLLPQGDCWVWVAGSNEPVRVHVPEKNTFHPDRRSTTRTGGNYQALDVSGFVSQMSHSLAKHIELVKENDPAALKREIAALRKQVEQKNTEIQIKELPVVTEGNISGLATLVLSLNEIAGSISQSIQDLSRSVQIAQKFVETKAPTIEQAFFSRPAAPQTRERMINAVPADESMSVPQQRIVNALMWLREANLYQPKRTIVAFLAGQSPKSSGFKNNLGALRSSGALNYSGSDSVELTNYGVSIAEKPEGQITAYAIQDAIVSRLPRPQARILELLISCYPSPMDRSLLAERANQSPLSSGYKNNLGALRSLGIVEYAGSQAIKALPVLFLE